MRKKYKYYTRGVSNVIARHCDFERKGHRRHLHVVTYPVPLGPFSPPPIILFISLPDEIGLQLYLGVPAVAATNAG